MSNEKLTGVDRVDASMILNTGIVDVVPILGRYEMWCVRDGIEIWRDTIDNIITDVGANYLLDIALATGGSITGPFLGLISSDGYTSAPAAGNTMASHAGWYEAGSAHPPEWDTPASSARITCNGGFNAAGSRTKALTAAKSYTMSVAGTVKGAFMVIGSGAVGTNGDTNGVLLSAGLFTGGDKGPLADNDILNVTWQAQLGT